MPDVPMPVEVFISYARDDKPLLNKLEKHLRHLHRQGLLITVWHRGLLAPGTDWMQAVDVHLQRASVILLLVSPDFFDCDYCRVEMKQALQRDPSKQALVLPILLRPVDWNGAEFWHLQVLPTNAKPITTWENQDAAFTEVAIGIRQAIEDFVRSGVSP